MSFMDLFFFFKQKTAYEMRISDWSSDVCSSDLTDEIAIKAAQTGHMVLSTLHTNDAPQTIARLMNMGIALVLQNGAMMVFGPELESIRTPLRSEERRGGT